MGIRDESIKRYLLDLVGELYGKLTAEKEVHYLESLKSWTDGDLKETFSWIRDSFEGRYWPTINELHKARKASRGSLGLSGNRAGDFEQPWEKREREIRTMVNLYIEGFKQSTLHSQAMAQRWDLQLLDYVKSVAHVQAQMIVASNNGIGWDSRIFSYDQLRDLNFDALRRAWFDQQRQAVAAGRIDVTIPADMIEQWRSRAQRVEQPVFLQPAEKNHIPDARKLVEHKPAGNHIVGADKMVSASTTAQHNHIEDQRAMVANLARSTANAPRSIAETKIVQEIAGIVQKPPADVQNIEQLKHELSKNDALADVF